MSISDARQGRDPKAGSVPVEATRDVEAVSTPIPRQRRLSPAGRRLLGYLRSLEARHGRGVWPAVETMAHAVGVTTRTIQRQLVALASGGWLIVVEDPRSPVGRRLYVASETRTSRPDVTLWDEGAEKIVSHPSPPATTTTPAPGINRKSIGVRMLPTGNIASDPGMVPIGTTDPALAIDWWLGTPKARGIRNRDGFRRVALARGVDASIVEAFRLARMPRERPSPHPRVPADPVAERAEAASVAAFLEAAKVDPSHPLFQVMRRRAARA